ncbi:unnamed protein product [Orchesella dallaii]|uniref:Uncharacterized protein n=1 Tax=Orchesella dallaii TaxID=48710 RepID=A0ABP1QM15_9HEXA
MKVSQLSSWMEERRAGKACGFSALSVFRLGALLYTIYMACSSALCCEYEDIISLCSPCFTFYRKPGRSKRKNTYTCKRHEGTRFILCLAELNQQKKQDGKQNPDIMSKTMLRYTRPKCGSLILLLAICISLTSFAEGAASSPVAAATTSSSTSANGLPLPPSKASVAAAAVSSEANTSGTQSDSVSYTNGNARLSNLHQPLLSSPNEENIASSTSIKPTNNDIAHSQGENGNEQTPHGAGEMNKIMSGQQASSFVDFPPFSNAIPSQPRYQRQRRSYPMPSISQQESLSSGPSFRFTRPDELELRLDDERDREAFLKLMSIITSNNNNRLINELSPLLVKSEDDDSQDEGNDDGGNPDEDAIDLGAFQRPVANPYWTPSGGRPSESINLMSSLLAAESPRASSSSSRGMYGVGERTALPYEIDLGPLRTSNDDSDGEWMENSVPLRGPHFKTRRSGMNANTEFTFNPVKSHFRRYLRAVPLKSGRGLEFMPSAGKFGPLIAGSAINRRRRATMGSVASDFPAVRWM